MTTMFKTTPPDLSPMKRSKSNHPYFNGHIVENSKRQLCFVGFSGSQHATISALQAEQEPLVIPEVKQRHGKDMVILISNSAAVECSRRKFDNQECIQAKAECSKCCSMIPVSALYHQDESCMHPWCNPNSWWKIQTRNCQCWFFSHSDPSHCGKLMVLPSSWLAHILIQQPIGDLSSQRCNHYHSWGHKWGCRGIRQWWWHYTAHWQHWDHQCTIVLIIPITHHMQVESGCKDKQNQLLY